MKQLAILFFTFMSVILIGCEDIMSPSYSPGDALYLNSFETNADTTGWNGFGTLRLFKEAPQVGGKQSVFISGGCTVPHAILELPEIDYNMRVELKLWGKNLGTGGGIALKNVDTGEHISVRVSDSTWTQYRSSQQLIIKKGNHLQLSMSSGGFIPSAMLVDLVEIAVVE